jgi:hypothetical protein
MKYAWVIAMLVGSSLSMPAFAQQSAIKGEMTKGDKNWNALEKVLQEADQAWLCKEKFYREKAQVCTDERDKFKTDSYFEIVQTGQVLTKVEQTASQTEANKTHPTVPAGQGANSENGLKLMAVYGNIALAADHTIYKAADASGKMAVTAEAQVLRVFVKENGQWRPAAAAQVRIVPK